MKLRCNTAEVGDNMAGIEIGIDDAELEKIYNALKKYPAKAETAIIRTKNDTAQRTLTPLKRAITAKYSIKQNALMGGDAYKGESSNNLIKVIKTNSINLDAGIRVRGSNLTLYRFVKGNKQPRNKKGKGYVNVQVKKGGAKKMSRYNFIQYGTGGQLQIFQRHSNSRKISRLLKTTSVAHMASNKDVAPKVQEAALETIKKRSEHYINQALKSIKK